jgi:hypothetical protein
MQIANCKLQIEESRRRDDDSNGRIVMTQLGSGQVVGAVRVYGVESFVQQPRPRLEKSSLKWRDVWLPLQRGRKAGEV